MQTIFELNCTQKSVPFVVMKEKRSKHTETIEKYRNKMEELDKVEEHKQAELDEQREVSQNQYEISKCYSVLKTFCRLQLISLMTMRLKVPSIKL